MAKWEFREAKSRLIEISSVRRVDLVDHEVDDYAGDADVEPQGEGPAGDLAVLIEAFDPRATEGDEDERNDDDGEDGVRDEQREIDRANPALALEVDYLMDADVVDNVGNEEGTGNEERGDHELLVKLHFARPYGGVAASEEDGGDAVESGVQGGVRNHLIDRGPFRRFADNR